MARCDRGPAALWLALCLLVPPAGAQADPPRPGPGQGAEPSAAEVKAFMRQLAEYVRDHHMKRDADSPQKGMVYEYFDVSHAGRDDAWIEGEALDTMHDGAWFAVALVHAHRATGDPFYRELLTQWILPFYVNTLNQSDTLFDPACNAYQGPPLPPAWVKEHLLAVREKGFLPYFWDNGASVSLEASRRKDGQPSHPACDRLLGKANPRHRLDGYSLGCSNHLAQDLGVMLMQAWLLLRDSADPAEHALADRTAEAARHLAESRLKRAGPIPAVMAAVAPFDPAAARTLPVLKQWDPDNHATRALVTFKPGQKVSMPGFADDDVYHYHAAVARAGGSLPRPEAQRLVYNALTNPILYAIWSDDAPVPPGMNRFDLYPYAFQDGKPVDYRSDRPRPAGSRLGPQNMVVTAWALQALSTYPGLYEERRTARFAGDVPVDIVDIGVGGRIIDRFRADQTGVRVGPATLACASTRRGLLVWITTREPDLTVRIHAGPDLTGSSAEITLHRGQDATVENDRGEALQVRRVPQLKVPEGFQSFLGEVLYTSAKGQAPWANGVEHGRLSVAVGDARRNLYLMSREERVKAALHRELAGGIRTWQSIFKERGYIPTSLGAGAVADRRWDDLSDTGGYAHLLSALAQYLILQDGKTDWQQMRYPSLQD